MTNEVKLRENVEKTLPTSEPFPNPIQKESILIENYLSDADDCTFNKINEGRNLIKHQSRDIDKLSYKLHELNMEIDKKDVNIKELE